MYSVVLLMAVTAGSESPDFHHHHGCYGCYGGCGGVVVSSCYGGCYGCYGGCYGGCCGVVTYSSCYGCYGGCCGTPVYYGCCGTVTYSSCYGCYGGCCGTPVYTGCCGTPVYYGCCGTVTYSGCCGTPVYYGCCGTVTYQGCCGSVVVPEKKPDMKGKEHKGKKGGDSDDEVSARNAATILVKVPADAKLTIDGSATVSTSSLRTFTTPELVPGKVYGYTFVATYTDGGKPVSVTRKVRVEAGKTTRLDLSDTMTVVRN